MEAGRTSAALLRLPHTKPVANMQEIARRGGGKEAVTGWSTATGNLRGIFAIGRLRRSMNY